MKLWLVWSEAQLVRNMLKRLAHCLVGEHVLCFIKNALKAYRNHCAMKGLCGQQVLLPLIW